MNSKISRFELRPGYSISRVIKGGWHLAGGHGRIDEQQAILDMKSFVEAGVTTFDCADIYTGVETLIGKFLRRYRGAFVSDNLPSVQIHTKYVPDENALATLTKEDTTAVIDRSLKRLGVERLDLVQFAWWNYEIPGYVETALHLTELQQAGKIRFIGATNFDAKRMEEMLLAGAPIVANQVQYSVLDRRPEAAMTALAQKFDFALLCYGVIAGGYLSDRYLGAIETDAALENRSLVKYRLIIDEFGGYALFQKALSFLHEIAQKYKVGVAEIAAKYVLQKPSVAGVIVGARNARHLKNLLKLEHFELDADDLKIIDVVVEKAQGPVGPVYELERDRNGKHGKIMRYNLNGQR